MAAASSKDSSADVVELSTANYRIDTGADPAEQYPPFTVHLIDDGQTREFVLPEPDGEQALDLEEAQTTRAFFMIAFDDQWPDARPLIEKIRDRKELMRLAYRYSKHFEIDPALLADEEDARTRNRADRRSAGRRRRANR